MQKILKMQFGAGGNAKDAGSRNVQKFAMLFLVDGEPSPRTRIGLIPWHPLPLIPLGRDMSKIKTIHLKVKSEAWPWLNAAAIEVNQVWNYCLPENRNEARR